MNLPSFRYHPDPVASGSIMASEAECRGCGRKTGWIYSGPVYSEEDLEDALCPWCIADGTANRKFEATFVDSEAFGDEVSGEEAAVICERTPGFNTWQLEVWPSCCEEPAAFIMPAGIGEIRKQFHSLEGPIMSHIVHDWGISSGAARKMLESLHKDRGPTAYVFRCLHCGQSLFHLDRP